MDEHKSTPPIADEIAAKRSEKVQNFKVDFDMDDIPDVPVKAESAEEQKPAEKSEETTEPQQATDTAADESPEPMPEEPEEEPAPKKAKKNKRSRRNSWIKRLIYACLILLVSGALASFLVVFLLDSMAMNRPAKQVDVEVPSGANTEQIAQMLEEKGLIEHPLCFRIFSKMAKADGTYQAGAFTLSPDMGYAAIVEQLQTMTPRETVTVTIPEGYTVEETAKLLEEKGVCTPESFYEAVINGEFDYDFVKAIPTEKNGKEYEGRIYRLEGYLFPDTYNFYVGSSGETVVARMLENFNTKLTPELRKAIKDRGWTIDQAVIMASLIQGEAASKEDMVKVSKVLENRLKADSGFPKLELCSTRDYVQNILPSIGGVEVTSIAYNTYKRPGLPVGAINNPGLQALEAALHPSTDKDMEKCYFFATDYDTGITYFSKTFAQHEAVCRKYKIGMYG